MTDDDKEKNRRFRGARADQLKRDAAIQAETFAEVKRYLDEAEVRIKAALAGTPGDFEAWRLPQLQAEIRRAMSDWEARAGGVVGRGMDRAWAAGQDLVTEPLKAAGVDLSARLVAIDPSMLDQFKLLSTDRIRDISTQAVSKINTEIAQAALGVQTPFEAASKAAAHLDGGEARALTMVRLELGTLYAAAGHKRMASAVKAGLAGLQKQWRRSGKRHPRITHDLADGQIQDVDKPFLVGGKEIMFPRDPAAPIGERIHCGCGLLPYMRHWRVSAPAERPYAAEELASSPTARKVDQVRADEDTRRLQAALGESRMRELRSSLAQTPWGSMAAHERPPLNEAEALALHAYTFVRGRGGAREINESLRAGAPGPELAALVEVQRQALTKLPPYARRTERWVDLPDVVVTQMTATQEFVELGFFSTTQIQAGEFDTWFTARPHHMLIDGKSGRDISIFSTFAQAEVIYLPSTRFRVRAIARNAQGKLVIKMEEV